ncbi:MAG: hypothetical protein GYA52_02270, partial [Chloroflexi bacterium]|nr:hypothetical protein [Chloroflexota bacterium]
TLVSLRMLKKEKWEYLCFSIRSGLSYLFYDIQALNFEYFRRKDTSPYLGFGDYPMSRWFSYSKIAMIAAKNGKPVLVPACMLLWLASHLIWAQSFSFASVLLLMGLLLVSSTFFQQTFTAQNYNVLGWMFFPLGIYGLLSGNLLLTAICWLGAGISSITALAVAVFFTIACCIRDHSALLLLSLLPGMLVLLVQYFLSMDFRNLNENIRNILQRIGASEKKNAYKRTSSKGLQTGILYFLIVLVIFITCFYLQSGSLPWLGMTALLVILVNTFLFRFADPQSIQIMLMTTGFAITLENPTLLQGILFWLLIAPPAFIFYGTQKMKDLVIMPERKLKSIAPILQGMQAFLSPVNAGEKVLFAFSDPGGIYEAIFDGYRWLVEVPAYIATQRKFLLLPTWWTIFEAMDQKSPQFWGRSVEEVKRNAASLGMDYVIVYQEEDEQLDAQWEAAGLRLLRTFSWKEHADLLNREKVLLKDPPVWFLLQKGQA